MTETLQTIARPLTILSGCSGGGKSTLLEELSRRGYRTFAEPGRRIVRDQLRIDGPALPERNAMLFAELCVADCMAQFSELGEKDAPAFCDRSIIDAVSHLAFIDALPAHLLRAARIFRYAPVVFLAPPWPEIYETDSERRHDFDAATAEYARLVSDFPEFGYRVVILPRASVGERADFVLETLGL